MAIDYQLDDADRLLDELELAARSNVSNSIFYDQLLSSLKVLLLADSAAIVLQLKLKGWVLLAQSGDGLQLVLDEVLQKINPSASEAYLSNESSDKSWLAVPVRPGKAEEGFLITSFGNRIPSSGLASLSEICKAFAEVLAVRQLCRWESLVQNRWTSIQSLADKLGQMGSIDQAGELVVNRLVSEFSAARVSMFDGPTPLGTQARMLASSSVANLDRRATVVKNLERLASEVMQNGKPVFRHETTSSRPFTSADQMQPEGSTDGKSVDETGTFRNLLALSTRDESANLTKKESVIILEWSDRESMMEAMPAITHFIPTLCLAWRQQQRWLHVPSFAKAWSRFSPRILRSTVLLRTMQLLVLAGLVAAAVWMLRHPYPMTIEADAVLDPKQRRAIFSNVDGFVEKLLVEDGQTVEQGQLLAKLRSPALNLQIEEAIGQIKSISEKRNGLRVAVNQVSNSTPEALVAQTRISAEILLLETQEKQTRDKLDFLSKEQAKLDIIAPIQGVIVSRDLRRELETRPLRRGDILFHVADLDGEWQLNVHVADRDANYLNQHLTQHPDEALFTFDSLPGEQFSTVIKQVSGTIENPTGTKPFLLAVADIESDVAKRAYMGANARVRLACGEQPLWFLWCRPIVEALQKRAWLPSITPTIEGHDDAFE